MLFLGFAGFVLERAYERSTAAAVAERLQLQVYALLGVAEPEGRRFFLPDLEEARFNQIDSGLYGFIFDANGRELWRSPSALTLNPESRLLLNTRQPPGRTLYGEVDIPGQGTLAWASYRTYWETLGQYFYFVVMESTAPTAAEIREFQSTLYLWVGALTVLLSIAQYLLLRWGLRPLQHLAKDVSAIESGAQDELQQQYPRELIPVTHNLNLLIKNERERQNRFRTLLGDLAHSLKTPLAVLSSALQESDTTSQVTEVQRKEMREQLQRMDQIVSYQLKRAVKSSKAVLAKPVAVLPVLERLGNALQKVYRDKTTTVSLEVVPTVQFFGEESDLMELCGNVLDNAFKYGRARVQVKAEQKGKGLWLEFNDDGDGIAEYQRQYVLQRGARADTVKSGQGIGLAVVAEIVSSYGGEIAIARNDWGGASIKIKL
ncbi:MAG TPA: ATP-binding protein [Candidatus Acidoferrum sp.]|nr:ATP-binding protein [Candidatus Acidoferrum sp.]